MPTDPPPEESATERSGWFASRITTWIIGIAAIWLGAVILQGLLSARGWTLPGFKFSYELSGQFGDSFGALSAFMASLAAVGAWQAVRIQQQDLEKRLRDQNQQEIASKKASFETTFFNLLKLLSDIVQTTDIKPDGRRRLRAQMEGNTLNEVDIDRGKDALSRISDIFLSRILRVKDHCVFPEYLWKGFYNSYRNDLGHYFRVLYQIVVFSQESCPTDPKFYTDIVRAQMSNGEVFLLACNCAFGHGKEKFRKLVEDFEFFDNLDLDDPQIIELLRHSFGEKAFGANPIFLKAR